MLEQPRLAVLYGPPGTGKTTVLVELVLQAVKQLAVTEKVGIVEWTFSTRIGFYMLRKFQRCSEICFM